MTVVVVVVKKMVCWLHSRTTNQLMISVHRDHLNSRNIGPGWMRSSRSEHQLLHKLLTNNEILHKPQKNN